MIYIVDENNYTVTFVSDNGDVHYEYISDVLEKCFSSNDINSIAVKIITSDQFNNISEEGHSYLFPYTSNIA